jgi:hypothetical protein
MGRQSVTCHGAGGFLRGTRRLDRSFQGGLGDAKIQIRIDRWFDPSGFLCNRRLLHLLRRVWRFLRVPIVVLLRTVVFLQPGMLVQRALPLQLPLPFPELVPLAALRAKQGSRRAVW